jgi:hypothetical protein
MSPAPVAIDDPVPSGSAVFQPDWSEIQPHALERAVRRQLNSFPDVRFLELVVRRVPNGICLEGVMETCGKAPDVAALVREIARVDNVLNHLIVRSTPGRPAR